MFRQFYPCFPTFIKVIRNFAFLVAVSLTVQAQAADNDQQLRIVGSATVFPFTALVTEYFARSTDYPSPVIESNGTGGGIHQFCQGTGVSFPDIVNASRPMKQKEKDLCATNGIQNIFEIIIGYDGIIIAQQAGTKPLKLTNRDLWFALADRIPRDGAFIKNPNFYWDDVNASLPHQPILLLGPPPPSGTRESFIETVIEKGCPDLSTTFKGNAIEQKHLCGIIREDGIYADVGENDNLTIQKLLKNKNALGIIRFGYYDQNEHLVQSVTLNGKTPSLQLIKDKKYTASRSLYLYVKKPNTEKAKPLYDFLSLYLSPQMIGSQGKLLLKGLIPLSSQERNRYQQLIEKEFKVEEVG
jgi:phosphate transport system substrate-binding protein